MVESDDRLQGVGRPVFQPAVRLVGERGRAVLQQGDRQRLPGEIQRRGVWVDADHHGRRPVDQPGEHDGSAELRVFEGERAGGGGFVTEST